MLDLKALLSKILNALQVSETVTFEKFQKTWTFRRIGRVVYVDASADVKGRVPAGFSTIGTLPESMRPALSSNVYLGVNNTSLDYRMIVEPSGQVKYYQASTSTTAHNAGFNGYSYICRWGGGDLTSKFYEIFSHLERWWEYVRCKGVIGEDTAKRKNSAENLLLRDKHNKNNRCTQANYCTDNIGIYLSYVAERDHIGLGWGIGNRKPAIFNNGRLGGGNGKRDRNTGEHSGVRSLYKRRPCIALERGCVVC